MKEKARRSSFEVSETQYIAINYARAIWQILYG